MENYDELSSRFELEDDCHYVRDILIKTPTVTYLEDSGTVINGINIWGSPWQVRNIEQQDVTVIVVCDFQATLV